MAFHTLAMEHLCYRAAALVGVIPIKNLDGPRKHLSGQVPDPGRAVAEHDDEPVGGAERGGLRPQSRGQRLGRPANRVVASQLDTGPP
jgi:hypothetical protein